MHGNIGKKTAYWTACQILSRRGHFVRSEIEKADHGTFQPTYVKVWYEGGNRFAQERSLLPGYLFFLTEPDQWGEVSDVEGVFRVLATDGIAGRVTDDEMSRLVLDHAAGTHNKVEASPYERRRYSKRRPRPRPGKRQRAADARG